MDLCGGASNRPVSETPPPTLRGAGGGSRATHRSRAGPATIRHLSGRGRTGWGAVSGGLLVVESTGSGVGSAAPARVGHDEAAAPLKVVVDRTASSTRFVYPFIFAAESLPQRAERFSALTRTVGKAERHVWRRQAFVTDDMLAHVAAFVDPPGGAPLSACLWRVEDEVLRSPSGLGAGRAHPGADWMLVTRLGEVAFAIEAIELALFEHGVGFLTISALPESSELSDWFTFLHFFRYIGGKRASEVRATRTVGVDGADGQARTVGFFPSLGDHADQAGTATPQPRHFREVIADLLTGGARPGAAHEWWREIFVPGMLLPYASLFVDGCRAEDMHTVRYRLRNFFHADQFVHPSADDGGAGLLPYAVNQWFFSSLNGGGFLAFDAPATEFFRVTLPGHIRAQYFLLFLLALEQRFVLMQLSQEVAEQWGGGGERPTETARAAAFADIRDRLLAFTAQGYFAQAMQEEHHHRSYSQWQETFELPRLYDTVAAEVREMHSYLEQRQRDHVEHMARVQESRSLTIDRRLNLVTWLLGIPVSLLLVVNASSNIAAVRHLIAGPLAVQGYDLIIGLILEIAGVGVGFLAYRALNSRMRRGDRAAAEGALQHRMIDDA